ncbi:hypothetical protein EDC01DRAFT_754113, partial [Geopyxis carbonaria]
GCHGEEGRGRAASNRTRQDKGGGGVREGRDAPVAPAEVRRGQPCPWLSTYCQATAGPRLLRQARGEKIPRPRRRQAGTCPRPWRFSLRFRVVQIGYVVCSTRECAHPQYVTAVCNCEPRQPAYQPAREWFCAAMPNVCTIVKNLRTTTTASTLCDAFGVCFCSTAVGPQRADADVEAGTPMLWIRSAAHDCCRFCCVRCVGPPPPSN